MGLKSKLKNALFQSYFKILSRQLPINSIHIVLLACEAAQVNSMITFNFHFNFDSTLQSSDDSGTNINQLMAILKTIITFNYNSNNFGTSTSFMFIFISLTLLMFSTIVYNFFNQFNYKEPKRFLSTLFLTFNFIYKMFLSKVLVIPLINICLSMFECTANPSTGTSYLINYSIAEDCTFSHHSINLIISIFLLIFMLIDLLTSNILLNETKPTSKLPWSSRTNNSEFVLLFMKVILCLFYVFDFGTIGENIKVFVIFALSSVLVIQRFLNIVMLNYYSYLAITVLEASYLFNATIAIINKYMGMQLFIETLVIQFLASLFFGLLIFNIIDKLHQTIINLDTETITSETEAYSHIFLLTELAKSCKKSVYQKSVFLGIFQKHRLNCENKACKCSYYTGILNPQIWERRVQSNVIEHEFEVKTYLVSFFDGNKPKPEIPKFEANSEHEESEPKPIQIPNQQESKSDLTLDDCIYGILRIYLDITLSKFPKASDIILYYAQVMFYYQKNIYKALFEVMKIQQKTVFQDFQLYCLINEIERVIYIDYLEANRKEEFQFETIIEYNCKLGELFESMEQTVKDTIAFWSEIKSSRSGLRLYSLASKISEQSNETLALFNKLLHSMNFKDIFFIRFFSQFVKYISSNEVVSTELDDKAKSLISATEYGELYYQQEPNIGYIDGALKLTSIYELDLVGTCIVSGDLRSLGSILNVSNKFCSIFSYSNSELIKNSIKIIMPHPLSQNHNYYLINYLESANKNVIDNLRIVLGLDSYGFLIPIFILVKQVPNLLESIRFIGMVRKIPKSHKLFKVNHQIYSEGVTYFLTKEDGSITSINRYGLLKYGVPLNLASSKSKSEGKQINISSIIKAINFADQSVISDLKGQLGLVTTLNSAILSSQFDDYIETIQEGNSMLYTLLVNGHYLNKEKLYSNHRVCVNMIDLYFDNYSTHLRLFKVLELKECLESTKLTYKLFKKRKSVIPSLALEDHKETKSELTEEAGKSIIAGYNSNRSTKNNQVVPNYNSEKAPLQDNKQQAREKTTHFSENTNRSGRRKSTKKEKDASTNFFISTSHLKRIPIELNINIAEVVSLKLLLKKIRLKSKAKPYFIFMMIYLLVVVLIYVIDLIFVIQESSKSTSTYDYWDSFNIRNIHFMNTIIGYQTLLVLDNYNKEKKGIGSVNRFGDIEIKSKRDNLILIMEDSLNTIIEMNNLLQNSNILDGSTLNIMTDQQLKCYSLNSDYKYSYSKQSFSYMLDSIKIKISELLNTKQILTLQNFDDVFRPTSIGTYNSEIEDTPENILIDGLYIIENSSEVFKYMIILNESIEANISNSSSYSNFIVVIGPIFFLINVICLTALVVSVVRVNNHKLGMMKIIFMLDRKHAESIIIKCKSYLINIQKSFQFKNLDVLLNRQTNANPTPQSMRSHSQFSHQEEEEAANVHQEEILMNNCSTKLKDDITDDQGLLGIFHGIAEAVTDKKLASASISIDAQSDASSYIPAFLNKKRKKEEEEEAEFELAEEMKAVKNEIKGKLIFDYIKILTLIIFVCICYSIKFILMLNNNLLLNKGQLTKSLISRRCQYLSSAIYAYSKSLYSIDFNSSPISASAMTNLSLGATYTELSSLSSFQEFGFYYLNSLGLEDLILQSSNAGDITQITDNYFTEESIFNLKTIDFCNQIKVADLEYFTKYLQMCDTLINNPSSISLLPEGFNLKDGIAKALSFLKVTYNDFQINVRASTSNENTVKLTKNQLFNENFISYSTLTIFYLTKSLLILNDTLYQSFLVELMKSTRVNYIITPIFCLLLLVVSFFFNQIYRNLKEMLSKEKEILNIIPPEMLMANDRMKDAIFELKRAYNLLN